MSLYADIQSIASGLLTEFDQGGMALGVHTPGSGPPHNPGPETYPETPFAGTASGVTAEHVKDERVQVSDLAVIMPGTLTPKMADKVRLNGHLHSIVKISAKPAAGIAAAYEVIVRR